LTNEELASEYSGWSPHDIQAKTGIRKRHIVGPGECASDLAVAAAKELFATGACTPSEVGCLLLCTQSPDYFLPTTACLVQDRLGLATTCAALDVNLGCSGFVYGLGLAKGLIETSQAENVLLITAETYSKHIHRRDKSVRSIFGDAAAATWITAEETGRDILGPFVYGTDGKGAGNLIVPAGGLRQPRVVDAVAVEDGSGNQRTVNDLFMNGPEIVTFTLRIVPQVMAQLLTKAHRTMQDIDLFIFHQANQYMLEHLRRKLNLPEAKLPIMMSHCGNTVSSTIPILLKDLQTSGRLSAGQTLMLLGFGVGYSWAGAIMEWRQMPAGARPKNACRVP
jgi:3-oxoacyl-[acyl-carrier-protein] synthase-3